VTPRSLHARIEQRIEQVDHEVEDGDEDPVLGREPDVQVP
jgi:hypothetical protein